MKNLREIIDNLLEKVEKEDTNFENPGPYPQDCHLLTPWVKEGEQVQEVRDCSRSGAPRSPQDFE